MNEQEPSEQEVDTAAKLIEQEVKDQVTFDVFMKQVATMLQKAFNPDGPTKIGFSLFVFSALEEEHDVRYISNVEREKSLEAIRPSFVAMQQNKKNHAKRERRKQSRIQLLK